MGFRGLGRCAAWLALAGLCACDPPAWRDPAKSRNPDPTPAIAGGHPAQAPRAGVRRVTAEPPPPLPAWAQALIGRPMRQAFPKIGGCLGNTDGVKLRYQGAQKAAMVAGWGWDAAARAPIGRVVLADPDGRIAGAGQGGVIRRDVPRALPQIGSLTTGWEALAEQATGGLDAYGVLADGRTLCKLGHLEL